MQIRRVGLARVATVILGAGVSLLDAACSPKGNPTASPGGLGELERDTGVEWVAVPDARFGTTSYLFPKTAPSAPMTQGTSPADAASAFFAKYGAIFRMADPARELTPEDSGMTQGLTFASFTQREGAASVYGTRLTVVFDSEGRIAFVSGIYIPDLLSFPTNPGLRSDQASAIAIADLAKRYASFPLASLESATPPELTIDALGASPLLAYNLEVSFVFDRATATFARQRAVSRYLVDATSGAIVRVLRGVASQYAGTNVAPLDGEGAGEIQPAEVREFPVLGTRGEGGALTAPYYLQTNSGETADAAGVQLFARSARDGGNVMTSESARSWDTEDSNGNPGSAVDAYFFLGETETWWRRWGRDGYDGKGTALAALVHDDSLMEGRNARTCSDNAYYDRKGVIHVCPGLTDPHAMSVDLSLMAHEFQHAVNASTLDLDYVEESGALDESLADIFGQLVLHDLEPKAADCVEGHTWRPNGGVRNLVDPHASPPPSGPQPDNVDDPTAPFISIVSEDFGGVHRNDGIPNKAWSLMTFGGVDHSPPFRSVAASLKLDWTTSEKLYVALVLTKSVSKIAGFTNFAYALDGVTRALGGGATVANACAWYAVGVFDGAALKQVGVDPCDCAGPDAGSCDAGSDARDDASPAPFVCPAYNACDVVTEPDVTGALAALGPGTESSLLQPPYSSLFQCAYAPGPAFLFNLECIDGDVRPLARAPAPTDRAQTVVPVSGLGDLAYWTTTGGFAGDGLLPEYDLTVSQGNYLLDFVFGNDGTSGFRFDDPLGPAEALARAALSKLGADAGDARDAGAAGDGGGDSGRDARGSDAGASDDASVPHC